MSAPTPYLVSIAVDAVINALGAFLVPFVSGATLTRGQQNRVPPPRGSFVELTEILQVDLETPIVATSFANAQISVTGPKRIDVQVDFYGPLAGDQCAAVKGVFRTAYCVSQFPDGIAPLYCTDGRQTTFVTGEDQYGERWTLTASLQYNPNVYLPQQYATALALNIVEDIK